MGLKEMNDKCETVIRTGMIGRGSAVNSITWHKHENATLLRLFIHLVRIMHRIVINDCIKRISDLHPFTPELNS
jgi:hypothetical protein